MSARDSALELLAQGVSPGTVANTLGVTPSYISQLMAEEDFASAVQAQRVATSTEDLRYDKKLSVIEEAYLDRLEEKMTFANFNQTLGAFRVLNLAKRRREASQEQSGISMSQVVHLTLPAIVIPQFQVNSNNEIVEVEGQTMISATPKGLDEIMAAKSVKQLPPPTPAQEALEKKLQLTGLERARETLEAVRPVAPAARRVPKYLDVDLL